MLLYLFVWIKIKMQNTFNLIFVFYHFFSSEQQKHTHTGWQTHKFKYCMPTSREAAFRKASGDGLIDPLAKMGDIPPTSISIKPLRLEAFQDLLLFLFRGEPRKIYRQLMVSGRKALLEYIKSTYWRRESLPCELGCFCFKLNVSEKDGRDHVWRLETKGGKEENSEKVETGQMIDCSKSRKINCCFAAASCVVAFKQKLISATLTGFLWRCNLFWSQLGQKCKKSKLWINITVSSKKLWNFLITTSSAALGDAGQTTGSNLCFGVAPGASEHKSQASD